MARPRTTKTSAKDPWIARVESESKRFLRRFGSVYSLTDRELSGVFEIGCFLAIVADYERQGVVATAQNLVEDRFRYLTTPNGNPSNFSHVRLERTGSNWELRQQVRICSFVHEDVNFTPDIVVIPEGAEIRSGKDADYAGGKRKFFRVNSASVIAAHECKSMTGFPELYVSFIGMFLMAHPWHGDPVSEHIARQALGHLAPSLFVGAEVSNLHRRMVKALEAEFPVNLVTGIHRGGWVLQRRAHELNRVPFDVDVIVPGQSADASSA